jgi:hypothetical protein
MARRVASGLMVVGVTAVLLTAYFLLTVYRPGGNSAGMGPDMVPPPGVLLLVWVPFAAALFGLWLMWRVWRGSR